MVAQTEEIENTSEEKETFYSKLQRQLKYHRS